MFGKKVQVLTKVIIETMEWERIKEILEKMGCIVKVREQGDFGEDCKYNCGIYTKKLSVGISAPTYQEAIRRAALELIK